MNKKYITTGIIVLSLVMLLCALFSVFSKSTSTNKKISVTPSPNPDRYEEESIPSPSYLPAGTETEELQQSADLALLKKNSIDFLNIYFYIPNGTDNDKTYKKDKLSQFFTEQARKKYILEDVKIEEGRKINISTNISFSDISFFVEPNFKPAEAIIFIDCKKGIKTNEMKKAVTSHYQFSGRFVFEAEKNMWLCDEIICSEDIVPAIENTHTGD